MKNFLIVFISACLFFQNIDEVRELYPLAQNDSALTQTLYENLSNVTKNDNLALYAYKGAITTLMAKHAKKIKDKGRFFKEGAEIIETAIDLDPSNLEVRFIRLSVQENAPKIVGYHDNIEEDASFILKNYPQCKENTLRLMIASFAKNSKHFSQAEKDAF